MKKIILSFCVAVMAVGVAAARQPFTPDGDPKPCSIVITGDFESACLYEFKDDYFDEYPDLMVACKHSTVTYTAFAYTGDATVTGYTWEVYGDVSHTASGSQCTVDWSDDEWGMIVVTVVTSDGVTCTESRHVKLIDNPVAGAVTIPAYTVMPDGTKVIRVCEGMPVVFIDQSDAGNSDIAGIHWGCTYSTAQPSSTPTYTIENVSVDEVVTHRVYNNCGCYDEEEFFIRIQTGNVLELDCYGTVCDGAVVNYHATAPICDEYHWYVEGGTLIGGQGTANPVVQWDHPANGYGVIGLDGNLCGGEACPTMMSRRVPVIQRHLAIEGQTDVCVGEAVEYTLPVFGSTKYTWSVTPTTGVNQNMVSNANEIRLVFNQEGTYTVSCSCRCDFLDCGPYDSETLTVTVKPRFDITGNDRICVANACSLQTSPSVAAYWTAYDLGNANAVAATATGTSFSHTFLHAGRYLVTAENSAWCGPATFVLEVKDVPPAPTVGDLDPANRHTACPNQGIALAGSPSQPYYDLVWEPTCSTASPQQFSGDSVTISYQTDVCDVWVYNYDRVLQCKSANHYVHQVTALTPAPLSLPSPITACPGTEIDWTAAVPDQRGDGMLYEWTIQDTKQYCASVQGSHLDPGITLAVNEISTPDQFSITLRRTFCGVHTDTPVTISVYDTMPVTLSISGPSSLCRFQSGTYTGSNSAGYTATYSWEIEGVSHTGNPVSHTFMNEGTQTMMLYCNPFTYCTDKSHYNHRGKTVTVNPLPPVYGIGFINQTAYVIPTSLTSPAYSFYWTYRVTENAENTYLGNTPSVQCMLYGIYSCTVTDNSTGCSWTVYEVFTDENSHACTDMNVNETSYDVCSQTSTLAAQHYGSEVTWSIEQGNCTIEEYGQNNRYAHVTYESIGTHIIHASVGDDPCYAGTYVKTVDFIPDFEFVQECNNIKIINHSRYAQPGGTVYIKVTAPTLLIPETIHFPVGQEVAIMSSPIVYSSNEITYTFSLTGYGSANGNITPCVLGSLIYNGRSHMDSDPVTITSANPYFNNHTCDNTPIELTATLNSNWVSVASTTWDFGDNSGLTTQGNSVFHTFKAVDSYNINVTVTDNRGCTWSSQTSFSITSSPNQIHDGLLNTVTNFEVCPFFNSRIINFTPNYTNNHYYWWRHKSPTRVAGSNSHPTYQTDEYFTYVINDNYCQKEASLFVKFKNAPTAHIYADNFNCCVDEAMTLYGGTGPGGDPLSYAWSVTGPGYAIAPGTEENFTFTPTAAGSYTVSLTVTNLTTLCSSTTTETVTANQKPAAPTLAFVGSDCISDAPVQLSATGCTGTVHWNNGTTGSNAFYFTPGAVSAYCFDPTIGCNSDTAGLTIVPQPDLDALLTGCYEKCKEQATGKMPIYSLTGFWYKTWWQWTQPGGTSSGYYLNDGNPLLLPYSYGDHHLSASAPSSSCPRTSPVLRIRQKDICDCDSVDVSYVLIPTIEDCLITYVIKLNVCNRSKTKKFCIDTINIMYPKNNVQLISEDLSNSVVAPGDCDHFSIMIRVSSLVPSELNLRLIDNSCSECTKDFVIDLMPDINCTGQMQGEITSINAALSSTVAAYFDFNIYPGTFQKILALWTEPPMVLNYTNVLSYLQGLGMIDMSTLSQLVAANSMICFYAIVCDGNRLCKKKYCIPAEDLYDMLQDLRSQPDTLQTKHRTDADEPSLKPNPTTGEVEVIGTTDKVVEVLVMDMHGCTVATFDDTARFNISPLPSAMYIVRVKTRQPDGYEKVNYLRLVKK